MDVNGIEVESIVHNNVVYNMSMVQGSSSRLTVVAGSCCCYSWDFLISQFRRLGTPTRAAISPRWASEKARRCWAMTGGWSSYCQSRWWSAERTGQPSWNMAVCMSTGSWSSPFCALFEQFSKGWGSGHATSAWQPFNTVCHIFYSFGYIFFWIFPAYLAFNTEISSAASAQLRPRRSWRKSSPSWAAKSPAASCKRSSRTPTPTRRAKTETGETGTLAEFG